MVCGRVSSPSVKCHSRSLSRSRNVSWGIDCLINPGPWAKREESRESCFHERLGKAGRTATREGEGGDGLCPRRDEPISLWPPRQMHSWNRNVCEPNVDGHRNEATERGVDRSSKKDEWGDCACRVGVKCRVVLASRNRTGGGMGGAWSGGNAPVLQSQRQSVEKHFESQALVWLMS